MLWLNPSDLQAMNEDTIDKLEQNQKQIKKNQQTLIQGESGVAPRLCLFDLASVSFPASFFAYSILAGIFSVKFIEMLAIHYNSFEISKK